MGNAPCLSGKDDVLQTPATTRRGDRGVDADGDPTRTRMLSTRGMAVRATEKVVAQNNAPITPIAEGTASIIDNTLLVLPSSAVSIYGLAPNIGDKGAKAKDLWFGRIWQLRELERLRHREMAKQRGPRPELSESEKRELDEKLKDEKIRERWRRVLARWKGVIARRQQSLAILDCLENRVCGLVLYMHGSGGMTYNNLRFGRILAKMGYVFVAPDDMALLAPRDTDGKGGKEGGARHRELAPLAQESTDTDYWADNLIYTSGAVGELTYNTDVKAVLADPEGYKEKYEAVFDKRRCELTFLLTHLPRFAKELGVFLMATSEGAMTLARYDDSYVLKKYGPIINGRIISAFPVEYCYFTPKPEEGKFGGSMDVPTLNLIGTNDEYFGTHDSIAQKIAADEIAGYGSKDFTGNAFKSMKAQGMRRGLVCVCEGGQHDLTPTHDNFLRDVLRAFMSRPHTCMEMDKILDNDLLPFKVVEKTPNIAHLLISKPQEDHPQTLTRHEIEALRRKAGLKQQSEKLKRAKLQQKNFEDRGKKNCKNAIASLKSQNTLDKIESSDSIAPGG